MVVMIYWRMRVVMISIPMEMVPSILHTVIMSSHNHFLFFFWLESLLIQHRVQALILGKSILQIVVQ
jgi:hypothetical protein